MFPTEGAAGVTEGGRIAYRFARPTSYASALFTLPQHAPARDGGTLLGAPVLGDYELASRGDEFIEMVRQPHARNTGHGMPDALTFRSYSDLDQALQALGQGQVDVAPMTSFSDWHLEKFTQDPRLSSRDISIFGNLEFGQECQAMRSRQDLRRALGLALDRPRLASGFPGLVTPFRSQAAVWQADATLGSRSILADPRREDMRDRINALVKKREAFRPFAPAVVAERAAEFFDPDISSPFMLETAQVKGPGLPAITHVDGSARVQTVDQDVDPLFHALLTAFGGRTGTPVLLNTSFNMRGEPIVNSAADALACFVRSRLDLLVLGDFLIRRSDVPDWCVRRLLDAAPYKVPTASESVYTFF
ncbi:hypothetical protein ASE09_14620 [Streptomyces sp. Root66D1]|nr:hypothetical protein ASD33_19665 [Streptomyces sp. Root1304]KRA82335.1 hypothetical protein ASE09_14620 [Streptomyces sp. Root66D1]